jgi:butyryl-CoA dehydrogenase
VGKEISKKELRTAPMSELNFEDCRMPIENRLGRKGNGAAISGDAIE